MKEKLEGKKTYIIVALGIIYVTVSWYFSPPGTPYPFETLLEFLAGASLRSALPKKVKA